MIKIIYDGCNNDICTAHTIISNSFIARMKWDSISKLGTFNVFPIVEINGREYYPIFNKVNPLNQAFMACDLQEALELFRKKLKGSSVSFTRKLRTKINCLNWDGQDEAIYLMQNNTELSISINYNKHSLSIFAKDENGIRLEFIEGFDIEDMGNLLIEGGEKMRMVGFTTD